ncbi:glycolate oxidase subunit GlcE [Burkholderia pseudomallei]|uniref:Glycolate oxidase, subunit GlcE n=2 Tax=Burkholderia pseudomallei TaxID=28450 RepID=Q3JNY8_BURP1|nr:glycolate oxidase subunit GlcE [Burkholderia pseudomallei]ABA47823.1 glycolate oxidase, subunit GlcE [Burkholderia pseudomallei 1710b]AIP51296.1 FAD binding domain protein [Burkholderia pseudomallei HBPUB10134a]AIS45712.1 FAD binding domain protein [Burkholderia pseudomallei]AJX61577.1 FAD binding domain protein [Burkholderia pseudomallei Pasteur 52237]EDO94917.1 glycolate oxidase, GlcE subunit [Burkholderia pseudomallei Pasteur 52237]
MEEDDIVAGWAARIRDAAASGRALRIRGGGTKDWYGQALDGEILDTRAHHGIVSYDPAELVVTARAGTSLAELEATLAERGQMLPFEPPHFGRVATLGGAVAAGLAGPRRATTGAPRDFVLGVAILNGRGDRLRFGGQVVKNVAGYDVSRLMAGSLGTLGLMLELSVKVLPVPAAELTLKFDMSATDAVRKLNEWAGRPFPLSASAWRYGTLVLRLSGAEAAVKSAKTVLGGEAVDAVEAERFWEGVREQNDPFFSSLAPGHALWRLSLPSITEPMHLPGTQMMEWGGAQRWWITDADAQTVRMSAKQAGGHATLFRASESYDRSAGVFTPLPAPLMKIHRGLKTAFDPARIFNRGRLYPDL